MRRNSSRAPKRWRDPNNHERATARKLSNTLFIATYLHTTWRVLGDMLCIVVSLGWLSLTSYLWYVRTMYAILDVCTYIVGHVIKLYHQVARAACLVLGIFGLVCGGAGRSTVCHSSESGGGRFRRSGSLVRGCCTGTGGAFVLECWIVSCSSDDCSVISLMSPLKDLDSGQPSQEKGFKVSELTESHFCASWPSLCTNFWTG